MKRDWSLIRVLLAAIEDGTLHQFLKDCDEQTEWIEGQSISDFADANQKKKETAQIIYEHLWLLKDGGYIDGVSIPVSKQGFSCVPSARPRMTNAGHDLLGTLRSQGLWSKIKEVSKEKGFELGMESLKTIAPIILKKIVD